MQPSNTPDLSTLGATPFDYIVVGGGTAGLTVASRLSEDDDVRVLVVEAGEDRRTDPLILTPGLMAGLYGKDEYDWNFTSVPQPTLNNRQVNQARGKVLGGSSAINFLMMLFPSRANIDAWGKLGNKGWSFDDLAPYFRKFGKTHSPSQETRDLVGLDYHDENVAGTGPIQISYGGYSSMNTAWMDTFKKLGLKLQGNPLGGNAVGAFQNGAAIDPNTKTRSFSASAYYSEEVSQRKNLVVLTSTIVKKVTLEQVGDETVATGVVLQSKDGQEKTVSARLEVILAAGALQSPQILELSGIGNRTLLESLSIPVVIDNPNVGENMQDHPIVCQSFEVNDGVPSADLLRNPEILQALLTQYQATRDGPMGQSSISVAYSPLVDGSGPVSAEESKKLFDDHFGSRGDLSAKEFDLIREVIENPKEPSAQYILFPSQITIPHVPESMAHYLLPSQPENYITMMTILNHPFSRGSCHITSADVSVKPTWDPKYNSNPLDMEILARHVQFVERIISTEPFSNIFKPNGARQPAIMGDDLEKAREIVRQRQISVFHVSSSCAMKPKELGGVVNERLTVYGTKNLRVVDASIMPLEPLGNIQSVVYAVAEKAADLIKADRKSGAIKAN